MKTNKKGMTLVECIIAMAVFAIATTGFTMAATACMRAQAKSNRRMTKTNVQSTNLEHFSTFSKVLDPGFSNVRPMEQGVNQWQMTFNFGSDVIVNKNVYGYLAKLDSTDPDGVYDLSFFNSAEQVSLGEGEYWVTLYNKSSEQHTWYVSCAEGFTFFDNETNPTGQDELPKHIWAPDGGYFKFGVKQTTSGVGDLSKCLTVTELHDNNTTSSYTFGISSDCCLSEDNMASIYYDPVGSEEQPFLSALAYDKKHENDVVE